MQTKLNFSIFTFTQFIVLLYCTYQMTSLSSPSLTTLDFTVNEIMELLQSLDDTKAMGIDSINPKVLKHCAASLSYPIYKLF